VPAPLPPLAEPVPSAYCRGVGQGQGRGGGSRVSVESLDGARLCGRSTARFSEGVSADSAVIGSQRHPSQLRIARAMTRCRCRRSRSSLPVSAMWGSNPAALSDDEFAPPARFSRPIRHDCARSPARRIVDPCLDDDVSRVGSYGARFAGVVLPGGAAGADSRRRWEVRRHRQPSEPRR
jgi:hypothetical protein